VFAIGCDSNDDELSDSERFVGDWDITAVGDSDGDQTADFEAGFDGVTVVFTQGGTFTLTADPIQGDDVVLEGPYNVNETAKQVTVTISFGGQNIPLSLPYNFNGDDEVTLSALAAILNPLLGISLTGTAVITLSRD
jgi:hypothetical protein